MLAPMPIEVALPDATANGRDHHLGAGLRERPDQRIGIEHLVGDHGVGLDALEQRRRLRQIVRLSSRQLPARQMAQDFDQTANLGGQPAARCSIA